MVELIGKMQKLLASMITQILAGGQCYEIFAVGCVGFHSSTQPTCLLELLDLLSR